MKRTQNKLTIIQKEVEMTVRRELTYKRRVLVLNYYYKCFRVIIRFVL